MKKKIPQDRLQGKFYTESYARIKCAKCQDEVTILKPGQAFDGIPECLACKPTPKPRPKPAPKPAPSE